MLRTDVFRLLGSAAGVMVWSMLFQWRMASPCHSATIAGLINSVQFVTWPLSSWDRVIRHASRNLKVYKMGLLLARSLIFTALSSHQLDQSRKSSLNDAFSHD